MDFNVFGPPTETLLFEDWDELLDLYDFNQEQQAENQQIPDQIEFRIVESQHGIQPTIASASRMPFDFSCANDFDKIKELAQLQQQQEDDEDDD